MKTDLDLFCLGKPLLKKREFSKSELWILKDFKDEKVLNTLEITACYKEFSEMKILFCLF